MALFSIFGVILFYGILITLTVYSIGWKDALGFWLVLLFCAVVMSATIIIQDKRRDKNNKLRKKRLMNI